jgi:hypothetical protein
MSSTSSLIRDKFSVSSLVRDMFSTNSCNEMWEKCFDQIDAQNKQFIPLLISVSKAINSVNC